MAVQRKLPNSDAGRALALDRAALKLSISPPAEIILLAQTQSRLATVRAALNLKLAERGQALAQQVALFPDKEEKRRIAALFVSHYVQGCDNAAARGETGFAKADRAYFMLDATGDAGPPLDTDNDVFLWGQRIITGDANRIAAGKPAMPFPDIADVTAKYNDFVSVFGDYNNLKTAYDNAQEAIENMREDVDGLILRIWNEVEAAYSEETPPSKRRNARDWGVVYVLVAGTEPTPEDFSIMGKITLAVTGAPVPINDVLVTVLETGASVLTNATGDYLVPVQPPGTYTLLIAKPGYVEQTIPNIVVTASAIATVNTQLVPESGNGSIVGTITLGGTPASASVTIDGTTFSANTEPTTGVYTIENIPAGTYTVRATIIADPANFQTQTVIVTAGEALEVNFTFP